MKKIFVILSVAAMVASCGSKGDENSTGITLGKNYGPAKVDTSKAVTVDEMLKAFEGKTEETEFTFVAPIEEVCSKAGCWINVDKGNGETFMVRFKDHFTIPPKTKIGTEAYIHGVAYWDTIPVDLLQHFAEDAGKSKEEIAKITEPKFELSFEADAIVMKK